MVKAQAADLKVRRGLRTGRRCESAAQAAGARARRGQAENIESDN